MPTVDQNRSLWGVDYCWPQQGEEWSTSWGGSEAQWFETLLPRIHPFLPAGTIMEIAPGHGRWTHFLKDCCSSLIAIDVNSSCIEACQQRFSACSHIRYHVNDGRSLEMVADRSVDFAFSFDSLVHAEADVIQSYLEQLSVKLTPNGVGFMHHSHLGAYRRAFSLINKVPGRLKRRLEGIGLLPHDHWRAPSVSAQVFESLCARAGLVCIGQELVNWSGRLTIDAFSLFTPAGSVWVRPNRVFRNRAFMDEAEYARQLAGHYARASFIRPEAEEPRAVTSIPFARHV